MKTRTTIYIMAMLIMVQSAVGGTWTNLLNAPGTTIRNMLLLTDGTVLCQDSTTSTKWLKLTPDSKGSYINGTWSNLNATAYSHVFFASQVLQNGKVIIAGGEYGTGGAISELYDPQSDSWSIVNVPPGLLNTNIPMSTGGFLDAESVLLPNGNMLVAPVYPGTNNLTLIYNAAGNYWTNGPLALRGQDEESWVKLPDDTVLTVDLNGGNVPASTNTERYIPSLNQWISDSNSPVILYGAGGETGPGLLLPDGRAFFLGGNTNTAFYTPSGTTNFGGWTSGPAITNSQMCPDTPAANLVNGNMLVLTVPYNANNAFPLGISFYEFNPALNKFVQQIGPHGVTNDTTRFGYATSMLCLPDGNILYTEFGQPETNLYVYKPTGSQINSGKPTVLGIYLNGDGTLHLSGTLFNGTSMGAAYGDDYQMDSNYPIVRFTDGSGNVRYGRSFNWSSTSVATGQKLLSTECVIPAGASLQDSIQVVTSGFASDVVHYPLTQTIWVDFAFAGPVSNGTFDYPYKTVADGVAAAVPGATISIKAGSSGETIRIVKQVRLVASGGPVRIGQ